MSAPARITPRNPGLSCCDINTTQENTDNYIGLLKVHIWRHYAEIEKGLKTQSYKKAPVSINQSNYFIVRLKVDQRAGQLSLPHLGITKTEK